MEKKKGSQYAYKRYLTLVVHKEMQHHTRSFKNV